MAKPPDRMEFDVAGKSKIAYLRETPERAEAPAMKEMLAACVEGMQGRFNHAEYDREDQYPWNLLAPARAILARIDGEGGE